MAILITGGAGFIGSHLCERLLDLKKDIIIVDDLNPYYDPKLKEENLAILREKGKFTFCKADIRDFPGLEAIFKKHRIESIIHLAARAGVRPSLADPVIYSEVNVLGIQHLLELARRHKVKTVVFGSSSSVYGEKRKIPFSEDDPLDHIISPYALTKRMGEFLCKEYHDLYGLNITCLRFFTVYGPRGRPDMAPWKFTQAIMAGLPIEMYGDGTTKRDYTYVSDIVDGILAALERDFPFEIINLGDNNPVELKGFIGLIEKEVGKKAKIVQKPMQQGDVPVTCADISKAKRLLGYSPKVKIEEGIRRLVASHTSR